MGCYFTLHKEGTWSNLAWSSLRRLTHNVGFCYSQFEHFVPPLDGRNTSGEVDISIHGHDGKEPKAHSNVCLSLRR